ncbi:hypothetical protein L21SP2_1519 [Salinispira pacifica]|uniref:Uncharacterized protein n=1 Tax=Salinispira pacifica TaxID=1307761 RepID=V5WH79_9SPIO|nr:hypothetical protein L21SP2_1519 [Salinispira pacifica]
MFIRELGRNQYTYVELFWGCVLLSDYFYQENSEMSANHHCM